jgi:inhibitor of cysteine peptidase
MKARHQYFLVVVLAALGLLGSLDRGQAQTDFTNALVLTEADNGRTVDVGVGQSIVVDLAGNPTTGFAWVLTNSAGQSVLTNGPMVYTPESGGEVGVGGTFAFPFLAVGLGDTSLALLYERPWGGPPAGSFAVTLHVTVAEPRLSIRLVNAKVVISWPIAGSTNFFLEGSSTLAPPQWSALNALPLPVGTNNTVMLGTSGRPLYFRLHQL